MDICQQNQGPCSDTFCAGIPAEVILNDSACVPTAGRDLSGAYAFWAKADYTESRYSTDAKWRPAFSRLVRAESAESPDPLDGILLHTGSFEKAITGQDLLKRGRVEIFFLTNVVINNDNAGN